ncbi:hypothetical protein EYF80_054560 [Liparis tanakae]|uniref:Uncharacterized protein n=1 Tax=Liparis tanakae TaxID=230148 RepID=A0A4Z2F2A0_9TELE|nr:hypothetical protein EYF80_054560 [Liparis tanakae]
MSAATPMGERPWPRADTRSRNSVAGKHGSWLAAAKRRLRSSKRCCSWKRLLTMRHRSWNVSHWRMLASSSRMPSSTSGCSGCRTSLEGMNEHQDTRSLTLLQDVTRLHGGGEGSWDRIPRRCWHLPERDEVTPACRRKTKQSSCYADAQSILHTDPSAADASGNGSTSI